MLIKGKNLVFTYPKEKLPILKGVNFEIEKGRIVLFIGKSGSGKTTLLKILADLLPVDGGELFRQKEHLRVGYVSQGFNLFPHMTVLKNCMHPQVHILKRSVSEAQKRSRELFLDLGIRGLADKYPLELSGGQQQRVAIARALGMDASILLFDEPTSALDPITTKRFRALISKLKERNVTIVITSHDMDFVSSCLDKAYFVQGGKIIDVLDVKKEEISSKSLIYKYIHGETDEQESCFSLQRRA